jgi:quercetin dioxygenase-like cupin family protein
LVDASDIMIWGFGDLGRSNAIALMQILRSNSATIVFGVILGRCDLFLTIIMIKKFSPIFSLVVLAFFGSVEMSLSQKTNPPENPYTQSVTREVLASGNPTAVKGKLLELVRYTIPAGAKLPAHMHPGMQIERVEFGTLTYTVVKGSAQIVRADQTKETLQAGQTTLLKVGDSLTETGGMVHYGENKSDSEVILFSTSLFDAQKPKAILVNP